MATELTWLGHGSWSIKIDDVNVLLDPFLDDNPSSPVKAADVEADSCCRLVFVNWIRSGHYS